MLLLLLLLLLVVVVVVVVAAAVMLLLLLLLLLLFPMTNVLYFHISTFRSVYAVLMWLFSVISWCHTF